MSHSADTIGPVELKPVWPPLQKRLEFSVRPSAMRPPLKMKCWGARHTSTRRFFEEAFGMVRAGKARRGIYMSDGTVNVALLKKEGEKERVGIYHFGMWVDDLDTTEKKVVAAGLEPAIRL